MRLFALILCGLVGALPVMADVAPAVPDAMAKRIKASPDRFLEAAAILIHGFGAQGSLDSAGVDQSIALERASLRASAQRRLLAAYLNGNGAVATDEIAVAAGAASATTRGRLLMTHARADTDGDGTVSPDELAIHAGAEALRGYSEVEAQMARAVLACDQDGDGQTTLAEVRRALAALDPAT